MVCPLWSEYENTIVLLVEFTRENEYYVFSFKKFTSTLTMV